MISLLIALLAMLTAAGHASDTQDNAELLKVRETVWRAWFANDTKALRELVPPDTIVISAGEENWKNQAQVLSIRGRFPCRRGKADQPGISAHRGAAFR